MAFIYVITNQINGKQYVGKTNFSIERRFKEHIRESKKKRSEKRPLYSAINKYGKENFTIETLEECTADESANREMYWVEKLDTYDNGYNATMGGDSKHYYDYEELAKKYLECGTIAGTAKYFGCCRDTVAFACKECNVEIIPSQEIWKQRAKPIAMYKDGHFIREFASVTEASIFLTGKTRQDAFHIRDVLNGKRYTALGYQWKYV